LGSKAIRFSAAGIGPLAIWYCFEMRIFRGILHSMMWFLLKRLLWFVPTLFIVSLLAFGLSKMAPGDPVEAYYSSASSLQGGTRIDLETQEALYAETARKLDLHLPPFYVQLRSAAYPDTLYRMLHRERRRAVRRLIAQYGNWPAIQEYYRKAKGQYLKSDQLPDSLRAVLLPQWRRLLQADSPGQIRSRLRKMKNSLPPGAAEDIQSGLQGVAAAWQVVADNPKPQLLYVPRLSWLGWNNQYYRWISGFLRGDFGVSLVDGRPVQNKIWDALKWTLTLNLAALFLAFGLSILLGVFSARFRGYKRDRLLSLVLLFFYALPSFWVATLCLVFFTSPEYGIDWFPTLGPSSFRELGDHFFGRLLRLAWHLTLPIFCLTYGALALITRQLRGSMVEALRQDFIRTARAKGLPEARVLWHHAFRNALFPLITLLANVLPALLAGSVVIEFIFNIYGMGTLTVQSIFAKDWPVVYVVLVITALLTVLGIFLADLLYAWADPRVKYTSP
jgi:peptide/nickel transport system permease protein